MTCESLSLLPVLCPYRHRRGLGDGEPILKTREMPGPFPCLHSILVPKGEGANHTGPRREEGRSCPL